MNRSRLISIESVLIVMLAMIGLTADAHAQVCPGKEGCLLPHDSPGCDDLACCETVCLADPFCCKTWDTNCVSIAHATCAGLCGATASGSCFEANDSPSCEDATCCDAVCSIDPFCCDSSWDGNCAFFAGAVCEATGAECGDPDSGPCDEANGSASCEDEECCNAVCEIDPTCCDQVWDLVCVALTANICGGPCTLSPESGDQAEIESCQSETNDPCNGGMAETISDGRRFTGTFRNAGDTDVFSIDLAAFDLDGDGQVRVRISMGASSASLDLRPAGCDEPSLLSLDSAGCQATSGVLCVPAVQSELILAPIGPSSGCADPVYAATIEVIDYCGDACENPIDCLTPHQTPGCNDPECCSLVCQADPLCCDWTWDSFCTVSASEICGGPAPINDLCSDALPIGLGSTPFRQLLATREGPESECNEEEFRGGDVWFVHRVACDGQFFIGTCSLADFNTSIDVFRGGCDALEPVTCNDDNLLCGTQTSIATIEDGVCGEQLWIRVSGIDGGTGSGDISIECFGSSCPCIADLNGDGQVDGADFGLLLSAFGPCSRDCAADLDDSGNVDGADIGLLLALWGEC
ncbi:MAG: hypothetical protein P8J59_01565 [Phycisphaerales bacterium]|jgi:hypothetical protein|nr:hypothetical protein [Phycisphaerales bacterium]